MSPEQIAGGDVDPRSDVFSLGVVIYQMATRQLPFSGETRAELTQSILHATPEPITRLNPEIPLELERITFKCLDKSADARYQSARELLSDLWPLKRQVDAKARRGTPDSVRVDAPTTDSSRASEASELVARGWTHLRSGSFSRYPTLCRRFGRNSDRSNLRRRIRRPGAREACAGDSIPPTCSSKRSARLKPLRFARSRWTMKAPTHEWRWDR